MKRLTLGAAPPRGDVAAQIKWLVEAIQKIDRATLDDIQTIIQRDYNVTGPYVLTHNLDVAAAKADPDVLVDFVATLVDDLKGKRLGV